MFFGPWFFNHRDRKWLLTLPMLVIFPPQKPTAPNGNRPTQQRANEAGFRMRAPKRGQTRSGVGTIRCAVERGHSFLSPFGRVVRRFDRSDRLYLGWVELAACIIFIRAGFFR
jgi:hypothetical protein